MEIIYQLLVVQPEEFYGENSIKVVRKVEIWLMWMGELLELMGCPEEMKVACVICSFRGVASKWWIKVLRERESTMPHLLWDVFANLFKEKYL